MKVSYFLHILALSVLVLFISGCTSTPTLELVAGQTLGGDIAIQNNHDSDYNNCKITINRYWTVDGVNLRSGEKRLLNPSLFTKNDGSALQSGVIISTMMIECAEGSGAFTYG
jgi:hypothetical protein